MFGPRSLILIEGIINSDKYKDILENYLLSILSDSDSQAGRVFQQDLASCHTSKKMQTFFAQIGINLLDWPGNSPDLTQSKIFGKLSKENFLNMTVLQKHR